MRSLVSAPWGRVSRRPNAVKPGLQAKFVVFFSSAIGTPNCRANSKFACISVAVLENGGTAVPGFWRSSTTRKNHHMFNSKACTFSVFLLFCMELATTALAFRAMEGREIAAEPEEAVRQFIEASKSREVDALLSVVPKEQ